MHVVRIRFGDEALDVTLSPTADPDRLPMTPTVSFAAPPPRHMRRHEIPGLDRQRIADHVVSWNITDNGTPVPCSWPAVMEVLKWPQIYSALRREVNALTQRSESTHG